MSQITSAIEDVYIADSLARAENHTDADKELVQEKNEHDLHGGLVGDADSVFNTPERGADGELWIHPTEEEKSGPEALRRVIDKMPWNAYLIGFIEMAERFSYYGATQVFTNFIQRPLPPGSTLGNGGHNHTAGALGKGTQTAQALTTFNTFWVYVIPLFGAYVADTYLGRFRTICWSVLIALIGHVLLIVSSVPGVINHPDHALGVFVIALIIMGLGTGGFKANISPLVAEQYKATALRVKVLKSGERVIVDPALTVQRIYMYFYLLINVGALVGQIGMSYSEKYVGFWLAYFLPTLVFLLCPIVLWVGRKRYVRSPPTGSVLATALRILRYSLRGTFNINPVVWFRNVTAPGFWDKAKPSNVERLNGGERPAWMTFDDHYVDEIMRGFKACQIFTLIPLWWISYNQLTNNLTAQAATMEVHGLPNDVLANLDPFALIILIPIFANYIYPTLERYNIRFTPVRRIFWGFMTGTAAMVWAAVVQYYIYQRSPCGYYANGATCDPAPLNVWIQTGSYVLIAISEIFCSITGLEYAFMKAPKNMKSLVMSVFLFTSAVAAAINEAMNPLAVDPHFIWNYGAAAIIGFVGGIFFWICFRHLDKAEDELNEISAHDDSNAEKIAAPPAAARPHVEDSPSNEKADIERL